MTKTVLYIASSLDGYVAGEDDDISWLFRYNDVDYGYEKFFSGIGAIIQGKRAYEQEVKHGWEDAHPVPTFVLAHTPPERQPKRSDVVFTLDDLPEVIKRARQVSRKDIWIEGGANIAQQFLSRGLLDEMILSIVPVILGGGILLFDRTPKPIDLTLQDVRQFDKGLVQLVYRPTA